MTAAAPTTVVERLRTDGQAGLRKRLAGDLDNIVLKALSKEPSRRYASVDQFSEDVRRHLEGLPVIARPHTVRYRAAKFVRRNRGAVAAAALIALALVAGTIGTAWQARIARQERARAEQRFDQVRQLANVSLFDMHDSIRDLPGSTPARQLLVSKGLEYLDRLSRDAGDRPDLKREMAGAYVKVGDVQGRPFNPNLGDSRRRAGELRQSGRDLRIARRAHVPGPVAAPRAGDGVPAAERDRLVHRRHRRRADARQDGARPAARSRRDVAIRGGGRQRWTCSASSSRATRG